MRVETVLPIHGVIAEFNNPEDLVVAAHKTREAGYTRVEAYTPFPVHGLAEAIGWRDIWMPWIIFVCGVIGCIAGFGLCAWVSASYYAINVGGRPYIGWPSFIPVTFECTVLLASFGAFFGMLAMNGLPRPHHPIFNAARFDLASRERFFLCIEATDPKFDLIATRAFMAGLEPVAVSEVPA